MAQTIILIDDDQDDLDFMKDAIEQIDKSMVSVGYINPEVAINAIIQKINGIPDYVFIDINMTPFTGDKCLKELRQIPELKNTKIAMFSTCISKPFAKKLIESGANFTFEKPCQYEGYRNVLKQVLGPAQH
jgi:CheY-like chemotaxis protein